MAHCIRVHGTMNVGYFYQTNLENRMIRGETKDKSPVVSLNNLIVREVANQERGMYLISSTPPEMYELYASSKDDRKTWMSRIQQTALSCPSRDEFPLIETEDKALLRRLRADIQQKDREVLELLQERVTLFSDLTQVTVRGEMCEEVRTSSSSCRNLFRADTPHAPKAEPLLLAAICEVDQLTTLLSKARTHKASNTNGNQDISNGDSGSLNGSFKLTNSSSKDKNGNQLQEGALNEEVLQRLVGLNMKLLALQAAVIRQDSILELSSSAGPASPGSATGPRFSRSTSREAGLDAGGDAVLLQRQVELLQEELSRLRLKAEESNKKGAGPGKKKRNKNKSKAEVTKDEQVNSNSCSMDPEPRALAPLATEDPLDQLDGVEEVTEEEVMKISPRSDSPRDLQDIPEESES